MYEIWFSTAFGTANRTYKVEVEGLSDAQLIWDRLNMQFYMVSKRP